MKTLLATLLLTITTQNALACSCEGVDYTDKDRSNAMANFMESKFGIEARDIISEEEIKYSYHVPGQLKPFMAIAKLIEDEDMYQCGLGCSSTNEHATIKLTYTDVNDASCPTKVITLKTKMKQAITKKGFTSVVKSKKRPMCLN